MFANERQNKICEMIKLNGAVTASGLSKLFSVSVETIRRDLLILEKNGALTRVHGGAVGKNNMLPYTDLKVRNEENSDKKDVVAKKAMEFISDGDIIAIDSGSTATAFAATLREHFSRLTIVTHSEEVFEILRGYKDFSIILCGGSYMHKEKAFYGALTVNMLDNLHVKKAFIFPAAISVKYGIFDNQEDLYQVQQKIMSIADEVYILADSSKFEKTGIFKHCDISSEYICITDDGLNSETAQLYKENEFNIVMGEN